MRLLLVVAVVTAALSTGACAPRDLPAAEAAALLRSSPDVTTRPDSLPGREVVEVTSLRRISRTAVEAEFRWRDVRAPAGAPAPLHESMALFRLEGREWVLAALYKFD